MRPARFVHVGAAALLLALMLWGFQQFYIHGKAYPHRELTPPIRTLLIMHGTAMAAWMLLFFLQTMLIVTGRRRIHMALGRIGAVIAACIVVLGMWLGIAATRVNPPDLMVWGLPPRQFMAVPILTILIFGGLVAAGILTRRRPEVHRSLMLLATLAAMPAAVSRIDAISALYHGTLWEGLFGPFFGTLVVALLILVVKWLVTRSLSLVFAIGWAGLVVSSALIMRLATTASWDRIAGLLLG